MHDLPTLSAEIVAVSPGATHEGVVYDFSVDVRLPSGRTVTLFDYSPYLSQDLSPGTERTLVVSVAFAVPAEDTEADPCVGEVVALAWRPRGDELGAVGLDFAGRDWVRVRFGGGEVVMTSAEVAGLATGGEVAIGSRLRWTGGRYDLQCVVEEG